MPKIKTGDKYNKLTAVKFSHRNKKYQSYWLFKCICGKEKNICVNNVKNGGTKSCGCIKKEQDLKNLNSVKHGMTETKIYRTWAAMKRRCLNKNNARYKDYGGRGIKVCEEWLEFENFFGDMGDKPKGKSLDRIDNNGNYCKENCRWADIFTQMNNTRRNHLLTYERKTQTIAQWSEELGINSMIILYRINKGWSIKKTFNF